MKPLPLFLTLFLSVVAARPLCAQMGTAAEPVAYTGGEVCNPRLHDGGMRTADGRYAICYNPIETQPYRYSRHCHHGQRQPPLPHCDDPTQPSHVLVGEVHCGR